MSRNLDTQFMPFFTLFRRTYSAVSSFLPSSDDIHSGNTKEIIVQSSTSSPRTIPRHSFLIRVAIFVLLEFGFIALVSVALHRPIFLHVAFTNSEVKGAVTAIAIVWHALAVYVVKDILLNVFSAEWIAQYDGSQSLALQEVDIVSRLTTGFIDQAKHCVSKRATLPFCLSFLSSILLILLNGLGPSAIGVDHVPYHYPSTIQVAKLISGVAGDMFPQLATQRANMAIQLEVIENSTTLGFSSRQPNILIPWPSPDSMAENKVVMYRSDVIRYNFSCSWKVPVPGDIDWEVVDHRWIAYDRGPSVLMDPSIIALQILDVPPQANFLTSFLFVGGSATPRSTLNLKGIPSSILPCNTTRNQTDGVWGSLPCPLVRTSVLVCDPQFKVFPATVNATMSSLEASILPGAPTVKNAPTEAVNTLFTTSLLDAASDGIVAGVSQRLFLPLRRLDFEGKNPLKPLSLDEINQNMTKVLATASKAYLSGYKDDSLLPSISTVNTSAVVEVQKMALVGSKQFFVASSVTVGLLVILLGAIVASTRPEQLEAFELENIVRKLR